MKKIILTTVLALICSICLAFGPIKQEYYANGCIKKEVIKLENNTYKITQFYENGAINEIQYYDSNSNKIGTWITYNMNGIQQYEASFKNNQKDGLWKVWDNNQKLVMILEYTKGKRIHSYAWCDEKGLIAINN